MRGRAKRSAKARVGIPSVSQSVRGTEGLKHVSAGRDHLEVGRKLNFDGNDAWVVRLATAGDSFWGRVSSVDLPFRADWFLRTRKGQLFPGRRMSDNCSPYRDWLDEWMPTPPRPYCCSACRRSKPTPIRRSLPWRTQPGSWEAISRRPRPAMDAAHAATRSGRHLERCGQERPTTVTCGHDLPPAHNPVMAPPVQHYTFLTHPCHEATAPWRAGRILWPQP